ncbi:MAG TPA: TonB-dependent receptor, partial [Steroidobacteraceae bacterium]|nr:TonB-dependent receptor [Steroidobacteraceae bacterium]
MDLQEGVLPARFGLATGGVVAVQTKDGCRTPGGALSVFAGQRSTLSPSLDYASCDGALGSYLSVRETWSDTSFSGATPQPTPIHDQGRQEQGLGYWSYAPSSATHLTLLLAATRSDNELPNAPGLAPAFELASASSVPTSAEIDSRLNFRDYLLMASINSAPNAALDLELGVTAHYISQRFDPDAVGELIYQGVASQALHEDHDLTLQGDLRYSTGAHALSAGFYVGSYDVRNAVHSLVFPADAAGDQTQDVPVAISTGSSAINVVSSLYVSDRWQIGRFWSVDIGLRGDDLTGYTHADQLSPRLNVVFQPGPAVALHAGAARYMQVPSFLGIAPTTQMAFQGTTAEGPPGNTLPLVEQDYEIDAGAVLRPQAQWTLTIDSYYEHTSHYLDTGQFGVVPIFAPFNYDQGYVWGTELGARYSTRGIVAYVSLTAGDNWQRGVATGQFNFATEELAYIGSHSILLDHQPKLGGSIGLQYDARPYAFDLDATYSSGLASGFADTQTLPEVLQINGSIERESQLTHGLRLALRLTVLDLLDRVNQIRSSEGIGIFQAAYQPRRTLYGTVTLRF